MRLFVTGNPDWVVPAAFEERRFATLDVGDEHQQDHAYFAAIDAEMDNGGREALLYHLLQEVDCSTVNLRQIPHTVALVEQKLETATTEQGWWLDILRNGGPLPGDRTGTGEAPATLLFDHYIEHAKKKGVPRRVIETALGMFLTKVVKGLTRSKKNYEVSGPPPYRDLETKRGLVYQFPLLDECRRQFSELLDAGALNSAGGSGRAARSRVGRSRSVGLCGAWGASPGAMLLAVTIVPTGNFDQGKTAQLGQHVAKKPIKTMGAEVEVAQVGQLVPMPRALLAAAVLTDRRNANFAGVFCPRKISRR